MKWCFSREPDGMLVATLELRKKIVREIRRFKPEVVMTGDPTGSGQVTTISTTPITAPLPPPPWMPHSLQPGSLICSKSWSRKV